MGSSCSKLLYSMTSINKMLEPLGHKNFALNLRQCIFQSKSIILYLLGVEVNRDQQGGSSRVTFPHCTTGRRIPADDPNLGYIGRVISGSGELRSRISLDKCNQNETTLKAEVLYRILWCISEKSSKVEHFNLVLSQSFN